MIANLQKIYRRLVDRLNYNEAKARGPVPPVRVLREPAKTSASPTKAVRTEPKRTPKVDSSSVHVVSRGPNKNVYVEVREGQDVEDALREADDQQSARSLETIEDGLDPYNSGVFSRKQVWHEKR